MEADMHRLVTLTLGALLVLFVGSCGGHTNGASCPASFTPCGGDITGTWTYQTSCNVGALAGKQCPGATTSVPINASGSMTFNADGTFSEVVTIDTTGTETIPASCLGALTDCTKLDQTLSDQGLTVQITGCTGTASQSCTCTVSATGMLNATGKYTTAGNNFSLTVSGGTASVPSGYCVSGSQLELAADPTNTAFSILTK
jgi:hypothetical protein